jgi:membrane glycosyltransferase
MLTIAGGIIIAVIVLAVFAAIVESMDQAAGRRERAKLAAESERERVSKLTPEEKAKEDERKERFAKEWAEMRALPTPAARQARIGEMMESSRFEGEEHRHEAHEQALRKDEERWRKYHEELAQAEARKLAQIEAEKRENAARWREFEESQRQH